MSGIKLQIHKFDYTVYFSDSIDEHTDFQNNSIVQAQSVKIYFSNIKFVNSMGVRSWVNWIAANPTARICFYQCPKPIVDQINVCAHFLPANALVVSFYARFFSEKTEEVKDVLLTYGKEFNDSGNIDLPEVYDSKGNKMHLDMIQDKYFAFLRRQSFDHKN